MLRGVATLVYKACMPQYNQNYLAPSTAKHPPKALTVINAEPVESIGGLFKRSRGVFPMAFMSADTPEQIYEVYGTDAAKWEKQDELKIVPTASLPAKVIRNISFPECRYVGNKVMGALDVKSRGVQVNYDQSAQRPCVTFIYHPGDARPTGPGRMEGSRV